MSLPSDTTAPPCTPVPLGPPTWVRWHLVALLVAYSFMTWFNRVSMSVAYNERIKDQYPISTTKIGFVYSAFLLVYMLFMTPGGWLIDRWGPWAALVLMGFGSALFGALTALAGLPVFASAGAVLATLLVVRSLMGLCTAPVYPAASRVVANWMPPGQRALGNGFVQGAAAVGIACTFPLFGGLIDVFDWPTAFVLTGGFTALLALAWTLYATNYPEQHRLVNEAERRLIAQAGPAPAAGPVAAVVGDRDGELKPAAGRPLWRDRSLMLLTLSYAAIGYFEYLFFFWIPYYFKEVLKVGDAESRDYAPILYLAMAAGMALGGLAADRLEAWRGGPHGRALVPPLGLIAGAVLLLLGVLAQETVWIVTFLALALAAVGATEAPVWTTAVELGGRRGGTAAGIVNTGGNAGGLLAPVVTPWVSELAGWQWGISVGTVVGLLGAVLWWWINPVPVRDGGESRQP
jgi:MFS family permease